MKRWAGEIVGQATDVVWFDHMQEYVDLAHARVKESQLYRAPSGARSKEIFPLPRGGNHVQSTPAALKLLERGAPEAIPMIMPTEDYIIQPSEEDGVAFDMSCFGSRINMGRHIAGLPRDMYLRKRSPVERLHVRVFVSVSVSAGCVEEFAQRGRILLGLLESLKARGATCELYIFEESGGRRSVMQCFKCPEDMSTTAAIFTCVDLVGNLWYPMAEIVNKGSDGAQWPTGYGSDLYFQEQRAILGMAPTDILVNAAYYGAVSMSNPRAWIRQQLDTVFSKEEVQS